MKKKPEAGVNTVSLVSKKKEAAYFAKIMKHKEAQAAYDEVEDLDHFVDQIKSAMKKEHLSYYAVAKKGGLRHQVLARLLNESNEPKNAEWSTLKKAAHGVGARLPLELVFEKK
jgi:phosphoribosylformylglycinamidine (FGAM) synthase-like enzyme